MADKKKEKTEEKDSGGGSIMGLIITLVILTAVAGGGGALLGWKLTTPPEAASGNAQDGAKALADTDSEHERVLLKIPPVITNLGKPDNIWIRLELGVVFGHEIPKDHEVVMAELGEDIVAYLRTLSVNQIQGASGFLHLREDLNERAKIRTDGKAMQVVILGIILE